LLKRNPNLIAPDLIICDEAHHAIARTWKNLIEQLSTSNGARLIGLTATPIRGTTAEDKELIEFFLGPDNIIDIDPGGELTPIDYLQKQGYLANVERQDKIKHDSKFIVPTAIWKAVAKSRDLPEDFLEILAQDNKRNYAIAKKLLELGKAKKRTLYFGTNRFQAKLMCAVLISFDIAAAYVDGDTPKAYRKDVINKFKSGDIDIICNCELFTTGFDEPEIQAIVIGRPTMSRILYQQMVGRGMRGPKMGGTPSFELYEMDDGLEQYGIALADRYFIDQWNEY
jgi:superfamily II DNA or RNA helicase